MARAKGGRPTKLTPELQTQLCDLIAQKGLPEGRAAEAMGITATTLINWKNRGRAAQSGRYFEFVQALKEATAGFQQRHLENVVKAANEPSTETREVMRRLPDGRSFVERVTVTKPPDTRASMWLLEHKFPEEWGRHYVTVNKYKDKTDEEIQQLLLEMLQNAQTDEPDPDAPLAQSDTDTSP